MVVIAIIGMLVGLLLPVVQQGVSYSIAGETWGNLANRTDGKVATLPQ